MFGFDMSQMSNALGDGKNHSKRFTIRTERTSSAKFTKASEGLVTFWHCRV